MVLTRDWITSLPRSCNDDGDSHSSDADSHRSGESHHSGRDDSKCSSGGDDCCACDSSIGMTECDWSERATCRDGYEPRSRESEGGGCWYSCYPPMPTGSQHCPDSESDESKCSDDDCCVDTHNINHSNNVPGCKDGFVYRSAGPGTCWSGEAKYEKTLCLPPSCLPATRQQHFPEMNALGNDFSFQNFGQADCAGPTDSLGSIILDENSCYTFSDDADSKSMKFVRDVASYTLTFFSEPLCHMPIDGQQYSGTCGACLSYNSDFLAYDSIKSISLSCGTDSHRSGRDDSKCSSVADDCCACDSSIGMTECHWSEPATCRDGYEPRSRESEDGSCRYSCHPPMPTGTGRHHRVKFRATIALPSQAQKRKQIGQRIARDLQAKLRKSFPELVIRFVQWITATDSRRRRLMQSGAAQVEAEFEFSSTLSDTSAAEAATYFAQLLANPAQAQTLSDMMAVSVGAVDSTAGNSMKVESQEASVEPIGGNTNSDNTSSSSSSNGLSGLVIGSVIGGVAVVVVIIIAGVVLMRNKNKDEDEAAMTSVKNMDEDEAAMTSAGHHKVSVPQSQIKSHGNQPRARQETIEIITFAATSNEYAQ